MKYLRFNFCHPVKVHVNLMQLLPQNSECYTSIIESKGNLIEIPLSDYSVGKWKIMLDWEHDGQTFTHQKVFEIRK